MSHILTCRKVRDETPAWVGTKTQLSLSMASAVPRLNSVKEICRYYIRYVYYVICLSHTRKKNQDNMRLPKMKPPNGSWGVHLICSTHLGIQNSSPTPKAPTERISSILRPGQGPIKPTSHSSCTLMIKQKLQLQRDWRNHKEVFFARESGFIQLLQKSWRLLCFSRK